MASLRQIKRRMKSVDNIHEITKAMEIIAGFRFKKAEQRFIKAKPYLLEMEELVADLSRCREELAYPLFEIREIRKKQIKHSIPSMTHWIILKQKLTPRFTVSIRCY